MQADHTRRLRRKPWNVHECDAVVLLVVGNERDLVIGEGDLAVEDEGVPFDHFLEPRGSQDEMRHPVRRDDAGLLGGGLLKRLFGHHLLSLIHGLSFCGPTAIDDQAGPGNHRGGIAG